MPGSSESPAAPAANTFGAFLLRPADLPPLPGAEARDWPASALRLKVLLRFAWSGGRHPCVDAVIQTGAVLIGIESKRYEPFRTKSGAVALSDAYWGTPGATP